MKIKNINASVLSLSLALTILLPIIIFFTLGQWVKNEPAYLLIHTIIEGFAVLISFMIFSVGWNSYHKPQRMNIVVLACAFLVGGAVDLGYILSYQGMPDLISYNSPHKAIIFWLAARLLVVATLLAVSLFKWKAPVVPIIRYILLAVSVFFMGFIYFIGLFHAHSVPITFIDGLGPTGFKTTAEILIMLILVLTIFVSHNRLLCESSCSYLTAGLLMMVVSELCFTLYFSASVNFHLLGHIYKVVAYVFIYKAIFVDQVQKPYNKLRHLAYYDSLTALPNRNLFLKRLIWVVKEAESNQSGLAVIFLDFDGFKGVNDSYGHLVGDQLLKQFAERATLLFPDRKDTVARFGGDEFILFIESNHKQEVRIIAEKLLEASSRPYLIGDFVINISSSIGISLYPDNSRDVETLIKLADEAMYVAKKRGKNNFQFVD